MNSPLTPDAMPKGATKVAILGRPNVGKSTLFNLLTMAEKAIVHASSGVTRDVRQTPGRLFDLYFTLLDTAGMDDPKAATDPLAQNLNTLSGQAAAKADILLFVVDGAAGLLPADEMLARQFRVLGKPIILVVNKADTQASYATCAEVLSLGLGEPVALSAAHSQGLDALYDALLLHISPTPDEEARAVDEEETQEGVEEEAEEKEHPKGPLGIAIVGRPNVGKSTFVNALLKEERMLTGNMAGLTRESIAAPFTYKGQAFQIVDTPGLRKKAKVVEDLENLSTADAIAAVKKASAVLLMLDASPFSVEKGTTDIFEQQDARIADMAIKEGKPLVIALNKWDAVGDKPGCLEDIRHQLNMRFSQVQNIPVVTLSAARGKGIGTAMETLVETHMKSASHISTSQLNRFLEFALAQKPPPLAKGKSVKLKYMTQVSTTPPTFKIFGNRVAMLPDHYKRYLTNQLRQAFDLAGVPLRLLFAAGDNPFRNK